MVSDTIAILTKHQNHTRFQTVIHEALDFIAQSKILEENGPTGSGQTSKSVAKLQASRKRSGDYKLSQISGLDETIESLENCDTTVWARVLQTDHGYIAVWSNSDNTPLGIMIFKKGPTESNALSTTSHQTRTGYKRDNGPSVPSDKRVPAQYILGAYWGVRREMAEGCASRLQRFLWQLSALGAPLDTWFETGKSRRDALSNPSNPDNLTALQTLVKRGQNRRDTTREIIPELGFGISLWNAQKDGHAIGLSIRCGLYWESQHPNVSMSNCVVLNLPENLGNLSAPERMSALLACVARIWQPERASVMSRAAMTARQFNGNKPFMDWMAYTPKIISAVEPPASAIAIPNLGTIIISQTEPPSVNDESAVKRISLLQKMLDE